ncbi:type II toxin-antitoxin system antitoxin SocA domain-containing protein [Gorillibacterium timonense]|uniref:type II toxin-antitoxin system antitoxin SocA domain-containing protein n=1 Tax=Gorillibacterium timonense TaxID=1689269 RepID=UPI00071C5F41|nr:type II toxin-antitoxin system antitoxin SocA domain-containing protein [Gorillibacterium timonense]
MSFICEFCGAVESVVVAEPSRFTVEGETFEIPDEFRKCEKCGNRLFDEKYDPISLNKIIAAKRTRRARKVLELTQLQLSQLLGWGLATVQRYEAGLTNPNSTQLYELDHLNQRPSHAWGLLLNARERLGDAEFFKLQTKLKPYEKIWMEDPYTLPSINPYYENATFEFTGNRKFDPQKLVNMLLYFAQNGVLKTKLMKLLWYSDFLHFKVADVSISGTPYQNQKFGPVPLKHASLLEEMVDRNVLNINVDEMNGYSSEEYRAMIQLEQGQLLEVFDPREIRCMNRIMEVFKERGSVELSKISHREDAWLKTERHDVIPYKYSKSLSIDL